MIAIYFNVRMTRGKFEQQEFVITRQIDSYHVLISITPRVFVYTIVVLPPFSYYMNV